MPRREQKTEETKQVAPVRKGRVNTKAAQHRHERNISKAQARRDAAIRGRGAAHFRANEQQDKIDKKRATRRRLASMTPAQRAERRAAGMEHRKPRKK